MEQLEFSLSRFIKYAFRYILVIVLCVAIGLGAGLMIGKSAKQANYEKYTARMSFDITQYARANAAFNNITEGDYNLYARQLMQVVEAACGPEVAAKTFNLLQTDLYNASHADQKSESFYKDLEVKPGTDAFTVSFVYDVQNDGDRVEAQKVISTYLEQAVATVQAKYPEFATEAYADVIAKSEVTQDFDLKDEYLEANAGQGVFGMVLLGAIAGAALAAVIVFAGYFLDPRIKSVKELLPEEKSTVLRVDDENAVLAFAARIKASEAKSILLASPVQDGAFEGFVARVQEYLEKAGAALQVITVDTQNAAWLTQLEQPQETEGYVLCLCNGAGNEVLSYLSGKTDVTALLVDQKKVMASTLKKAVDEVECGAYLCTLLHNVGRAYLD